MQLSKNLLLGLSTKSISIVHRSAWNKKMGKDFSSLFSDAVDKMTKPSKLSSFVTELEFCLATSAGRCGLGHKAVEIVDGTIQELVEEVDVSLAWHIKQFLSRRMEVMELIKERMEQNDKQ